MMYRGLVRKVCVCGCACVWFACVNGIWESPHETWSLYGPEDNCIVAAGRHDADGVDDVR